MTYSVWFNDENGVLIFSYSKSTPEEIVKDVEYRQSFPSVYGDNSVFLIKEDNYLGNVLVFSLKDDINILHDFFGMKKVFKTQGGFELI